MKLFRKKEKSKKPLSDKVKQERKDKTKRIIKRVLDILVYGFAIFMIFGLLIGSCNQKTKPAGAYYHSDNGYTSINSVIVEGQSTSLRYYYDYNYKKTFPNWGTLFDVFANSEVSTYVRLRTPYTIDNVSYEYLHLYSHTTPFGLVDVRQYVYRLSTSTSPVLEYIDVVTLTQSLSSTINTTINRSDILVGLFSGTYDIYVDYHGGNNDNWYRYLTYYFGELGYNRITYSLPISIGGFTYLFTNSDNEDNLIQNGYFFKNDTFPTIEPSSDPVGLYHEETLFYGSFRCNGVYYDTITLGFKSVYGDGVNWQGSYQHIRYYLPGSTDYIDSDNQFYNGYWYLERIAFEGYGLKQVVWNACKYHGDNDGTDNFQRAVFSEGGWVGDSYYSSSPYRDLYIYYSNDALSGVLHTPFNSIFPQLNNMTYADVINFIGEAYPSGNVGVPVDTSPIFTNVFDWLRLALAGAMPMFGYTLLPGITIGTLVMVPLVLTILLFLIKLFKR